MNTTVIISCLILCIYVSVVSTYTGPHSCNRAYTCYGTRYTSCGWWSRCGRTYTKTCYYSICCSGWSSDGLGGCTKPVCDPPCANGGTCINPDRCTCTIYYQGSTCWQKKACDGKQLDVMLILDSSGSIGKDNFELVKKYAKDIVLSLDIGATETRVGLMTFSRYPRIRFQLDDHNNKTAVIDAIDQVPYITGITETYAALTLLKQEGFAGSRSNAPHVVIIVTEGTSRHLTETTSVASSLQSQGVTMFAVGVGPDVTSQELNAIASNPDNRHTFTVNDYKALSSTLLDLITLTCDVPHRSYTVHTTPKPDIISHARQEPVAECEGKVADVMFVLDSSVDVGQTHFKSVEKFAIDIINDLNIGENTTQVGVITFNTYPVIRQSLNDDKLQLLNVVNQIPYYSGSRETDRALELLRLEGYDVDRYQAPNIAIIITNGVSHNTFLAKRSADSVKQSGTEVFVVGVGSGVNKDELEYMATSPSHVTVVPNFAEFDLSNFEFEVARNVCDTIQIITTQSTPSTTATTTPIPSTIDLLATYPRNDSSCIPDVADVIFLVDSSSSMGAVNFQAVKDYIRQTVGIFDVGLNATRIGLIMYSTDAKIVFSLDQYNNSQDILDAVDNIKYTSGGTNTAQALELMRTHGFLNDRNDTSNIAFLITDGYSKDKDATRLQARLAKQDDKLVMVVTGVGTHLDFQELTNIASQSAVTNESLIYHVNSFDELQSQSLHNLLARVVCGVGTLTGPLSSHPTTANVSAAITASTAALTTPAATTAPSATTLTESNTTSGSTTTSTNSTAATTASRSTTTSGETTASRSTTASGETTASRSTTASTATTASRSTTASTATTASPVTTTDSSTIVPPVATHIPTMAPTTQVVPASPPLNTSCFDKIDTCIGYGKAVCTDYQPWAMDKCRLYCGFCQGPTTPSGPCEDAIDNCDEYGPFVCTTTSFLIWARDNCPRYCQMCDPGPVTATTPTTTTTTEPPCVDTVNNCLEFGTEMCTNPQYKAWAQAHCSKFCGFCSTQYVDYQSHTVNNTICPAWHLPKVCKMVAVEGHCCPLPQCPDEYTLSADHLNQPSASPPPFTPPSS